MEHLIHTDFRHFVAEKLKLSHDIADRFVGEFRCEGVVPPMLHNGQGGNRIGN